MNHILNNDEFLRLDETSGLKDLMVYEIYKDSKGYVWIGTASNVVRYDGFHLKTYESLDKNCQLKSNYTICETPNGEIWVGNSAGLWQIDEESDGLQRIYSEVLHCRVNDIKTAMGRMFIATDAGIFTLKDGVFEQHKVEDNIFAITNHVNTLDFDANGMLWLGTEAGLFRFTTNGKFLPYAATENVNAKDIICLNNQVFIANEKHGICTYSINEGTLTHNERFAAHIVNSMDTDRNELIYVGTDGDGILVWDVERDSIVHNIRHKKKASDGLHSNSVYKVYLDKEGLLWAGMYQQGLDFTPFRNDVFSTYFFGNSFNTQDMVVRSIAFYGPEKVIGTRDGLYYINEENDTFRSFIFPELHSQMVFSILHYDGKYLIGTYGGGMQVLDPQTLSLEDFDGIESGTVFCIKDDERGCVWIGSSDGVYRCENGKVVQHYTSANSKLPRGNVFDIFFDSTGTGWICTENGLCLYDPGTDMLRDDVFPEGFINKEVIRLCYEDSKHNLYFLPDQGSLFTSNLAMSEFGKSYENQLGHRDLYSMLEDADGTLWFCTSDGLLSCDCNGQFERYTHKDGVLTTVFTFCKPILDEYGNLWFGHTKGLIHTNREKLEARVTVPYRLHFTDMFVDDSQSSTSLSPNADGIVSTTLSGSGRNVRLHISDFSYTSAEQATFEYSIQKEAEWIALRKGEAQINQYNLSLGVHNVRVRPIGDNGNIAEIEILVLPGLSQIIEWLFFILLAIGFCALLTYIWKHRSIVKKLLLHKKTKIVVKDLEGGDKYAAVNISDQTCKAIAEKLSKCMEEEMLWKNPNLKIKDLAQAVDETSATISYIFGQHLNTNYYDFVNKYRIDEFKRIVSTETNLSRFTIAALASMCGFSSRASFFRYFKKAENITPNEYIKRIGKEL